MTAEYRQALAKRVGELLERARVRLRKARAAGIKKGKAAANEANITKDDQKRVEECISTIADGISSQLHELHANKVDQISS